MQQKMLNSQSRTDLRSTMRGTRKLFIATVGLGGLLVMHLVLPAQAALLNPVPTSGHNADIILENDGSPSQNEELGSRWFFEQGLFGDDPAEQGLPKAPGRTTSMVSGITGNTINFAFTDYNANNVLMFEAGSPSSTLTLAVPAGYAQLAVTFSGGSLSASIANLDYSISYQGGGTQSGVIDVPDWGNATLPSGVERLLVADRANIVDGNPVWDNSANTVRWAVFVTEITPNSSADILSISFGTNITLDGGPGGLLTGDDVAVFGLAGAVIPEPSALVLFGLSALGLIFRRPRR